jgi:hypothetical protein
LIGRRSSAAAPGQVLVEARERGDAAVEGLGGLTFLPHGIAPALDVGDRGAQQPFRLLRPVDAEELDEAQDVAPVGALGVGAATPGGPALEHFGDTAVEAFGAGLESRGNMACQHRRQLIGRSAQNNQVPIVGR